MAISLKGQRTSLFLTGSPAAHEIHIFLFGHRLLACPFVSYVIKYIVYKLKNQKRSRKYSKYQDYCQYEVYYAHNCLCLLCEYIEISSHLQM